MISKTRRYPFNKPFIVQSKPIHLCLQTSRSTIQTGYNRWTMSLQFSPDPLSFGSRSLLVRSSFVSRSSLVAYSLVYRRPNEDRTRNKRKTNERATNIDRDADEKLSATRRVATFMAGSMPFCNHKPAKCLLLPICRGRTLHFLSTLSISAANKTISSIPWKPYGSTM